MNRCQAHEIFARIGDYPKCQAVDIHTFHHPMLDQDWQLCSMHFREATARFEGYDILQRGWPTDAPG